MREALARSDHDFVVSEPARRRKAATRPNILGRLRAVVHLGYRIAAYPNRIAGALVFSLTVAIIVNALMLQHSRHPAPLFHKSISLPAQAPPERSSHAFLRHPAYTERGAGAAAAAKSVKMERDPIGRLLGGGPSASNGNSGTAEKTKSEPRRHEHEGVAANETKRGTNDSIGQLLKSDTSPAAEDRPQTVLAVQHALVKLGFVVRPDGHMGAVTRHAIEQFEHDHGMQVEGRLTPKLLHRLAANTGIAIE